MYSEMHTIINDPDVFPCLNVEKLVSNSNSIQPAGAINMPPKISITDSDIEASNSVFDLSNGSNADINVTRTKVRGVKDFLKERDPTAMDQFQRLLDDLKIEEDPEKASALQELLTSIANSSKSDKDKEEKITSSKLYRLLGGGNAVLSAISSIVTIASAL